MMTPIKHVAALPLGFTAEFTWTDRGMAVAWTPDVPRIRSPRAWRKFREAYNEARRQFMRDVATVNGGSALIVDLDGLLEVVKPETRH